LSAPQLAGLTTRLRQAVDDGELRTGSDVDAVANALVGSLLLHALTRSGDSVGGFDGLVDALLDGVSSY
jgi:hypothetical protein